MKNFWIIFMATVLTAIAGSGSAVEYIEMGHEGLDCIQCHKIEPMWEVDTIETAPLVEGFSCASCHESEFVYSQEVGSEQERSSDVEPLYGTLSGGLGIIPYNYPGTDDWELTLDVSGVPQNVILLKAWVSCNGSVSPCVGETESCGVATESACASNFGQDIASKCFSGVYYGQNCPTTTKLVEDLTLPASGGPYVASAFAVSSSGNASGGCASAHFHIYSCTQIGFSGFKLDVNVPPTVTTGDTWQMTVTAIDAVTEAVVTDYTGRVYFELTINETYQAGTPKSGTVFPTDYEFVAEDDSGSHTFDIQCYTAGELSIAAVDGSVLATGSVIVNPSEPHCVKTLVDSGDPPDPEDPPIPDNPFSGMSMAFSGAAATAPVYVNVCPPMSVAPEYLPADGVSEAFVQVGDPTDPDNPDVLISDMYGNIILDGLVTVETTVGTIVTLDEDTGTSGIQVVVDTGVAEFRV